MCTETNRNSRSDILNPHEKHLPMFVTCVNTIYSNHEQFGCVYAPANSKSPRCIKLGTRGLLG
jgi:hypothetical protein